MDRPNERRFAKLSAEDKKVVLKAFKETMPDLKLAKPQAQSQKRSNPTNVDNRPYPKLSKEEFKRIAKAVKRTQEQEPDLTKD
jgi:hypothetical protein